MEKLSRRIFPIFRPTENCFHSTTNPLTYFTRGPMNGNEFKCAEKHRNVFIYKTAMQLASGIHISWINRKKNSSKQEPFVASLFEAYASSLYSERSVN